LDKDDGCSKQCVSTQALSLKPVVQVMLCMYWKNTVFNLFPRDQVVVYHTSNSNALLPVGMTVDLSMVDNDYLAAVVVEQVAVVGVGQDACVAVSQARQRASAAAST
jgi:hypothetical protein